MGASTFPRRKMMASSEECIFFQAICFWRESSYYSSDNSFCLYGFSNRIPSIIRISELKPATSFTENSQVKSCARRWASHSKEGVKTTSSEPSSESLKFYETEVAKQVVGGIKEWSSTIFTHKFHFYTYIYIRIYSLLTYIYNYIYTPAVAKI